LIATKRELATITQMSHYIEFQTMLVGNGLSYDDMSHSFFVPLDISLPNGFVELFKSSDNDIDYNAKIKRVEAMIVEMVKNPVVYQSSRNDLQADIPGNILVCKRVRRFVSTE
jgi:hypothetical protein